MQIGQFVQRHCAAIFDHCSRHDPGEFARLQDPRYCKTCFDINYPFCTAVHRISAADNRRYWRAEYTVLDVPLRVTNHWFNPPTSESLALFTRYLRERKITLG